MNKHLLAGVVLGFAIIALGGYVSLPILSTVTNTVANKKS